MNAMVALDQEEGVQEFRQSRGDSFGTNQPITVQAVVR